VKAGRAPYRYILLIVVALILYGSLYPWEFHARRLGASPLWILLHAWPHGMDRYLLWDIAVNVALYVPLGVFGVLAAGEGATRAARILAPVLLAVGLSASVEMIQLFDDSRECSASDVLSNTAGGATGVVLGMLYREKLQRALERRQPAASPHHAGALLLLCCWLGYQLFPLFPSLGRAKLAFKLASMGPLSSISAADTLVVFAEWLAVACLAESLLAEEATRLLAILVLVLPARLLIVGRYLPWSDLAGAAAAWAAWWWLPRRYVRRAAPLLLAGALALHELAPFHFGRAAAFNWVPFRGSIRSIWPDGFVVLFRKSFWYGSAIWLWSGAGHRLARTTGVAAAALVALELAQIYLPGRVPEITDAVLALLMGALLGLLRGARTLPGGRAWAPAGSR